MGRRGSPDGRLHDAGPLSYDRGMRRLLLLSASLVTLIGWTAGCEAVKEKEDDLSPDSISVGPANPTIVKGQTQQLTVTGLFPDETTDDVTALATYISTTSAIATVSADGLITAIAEGTTTINVSYDFRIATTLVTVARFVESEPNDNDLDANPLFLSDTFEGTCNSNDDFSDVYRATVTNTGMFSVSINWTEGLGDEPDLDLILYDGDVNFLAVDDAVPPGDSPATVSALLTTNLSVYIEVYCYLSTAGAPYFGTVIRP